MPEPSAVAGVLLVVAVAALALLLIVWQLRQDSRLSAAQLAVGLAVRAVEHRHEVGPPLPPTPPAVTAPAVGRAPVRYPPQLPVGQYVPVWVATTRRGVLAHRLNGVGTATRDGFLIDRGGDRRNGSILPAGQAHAIYAVRWCEHCFPPPVPAEPGQRLPRRRPAR